MEGFIKLDRALNYWRYKRKPLYVALWVHLLQCANYKDGYDGDIEVKRGQLLTNTKKLADETGLTVQNVRTILNHLCGEELTIKSTNKYSLITIVKYEFYQGSSEQSNNQINKQLTSNQQATNKQLTNSHPYYIKKERKEESKNIIYDSSLNEVMSKDQELELLSLMGKA